MNKNKHAGVRTLRAPTRSLSTLSAPTRTASLSVSLPLLSVRCHEVNAIVHRCSACDGFFSFVLVFINPRRSSPSPSVRYAVSRRAVPTSTVQPYLETLMSGRDLSSEQTCGAVERARGRARHRVGSVISLTVREGSDGFDFCTSAKAAAGLRVSKY